MQTPKSDAAIARFPIFTEAVHARLIVGKESYGDSSFDRPLDDLVSELQAECMDLAGWGFILHERLEAVRAKLVELYRKAV